MLSNLALSVLGEASSYYPKKINGYAISALVSPKVF